MKLALLASAAVVLSLAAGCAASSDQPGDGVSSDDALTATIGVGTYLVESKPWGSYYAQRITIQSGNEFEAEIVSSDGETTLMAGRYDILQATPNNPDSPIQTDKPTLYLTSDAGDSQTFEFDKLPNGELRLYHSARHVTFTMKADPSWRPEPTNTKTVTCTGSTVDAVITLDQAQNRRGTLQLTRKAGADRHDPPSVTAPLTRTAGSEVPGYVYFEGSKGEQDYYVTFKEAEFGRSSGPVWVHLVWAEGGQEFDVGATCKYQ